jgi:adenylylsulfate kinase
LKNIHPIFDRLVQRGDREQLLEQKSRVVWLTGLSGSGKSTIAQHLERRLFNDGFFAQVLDGDNIRSGINNNLGFTLEDRRENIRRIAEVARLYLHSGIITICSFISPTREIRDYARSIVGEEDFIEVFVNAPLEVCESRDVKGLYQKARAGEIKGFTGIDSPYEAPGNPAMEIRTDKVSLDQAVEELASYILPLIDLGLKVKGQRSREAYVQPLFNPEIVEDDKKKYSNAQSFEDLRIWQAGIELAKQIYLSFKDSKDFFFKDQINRAALSVPSNIAEGFERKSNKEFIQFLYIAKASAGEVRTQLLIAKEVGILEEQFAIELLDKANKIARMIANFIKFRKTL